MSQRRSTTFHFFFQNQEDEEKYLQENRILLRNITIYIVKEKRFVIAQMINEITLQSFIRCGTLCLRE